MVLRFRAPRCARAWVPPAAQRRNSAAQLPTSSGSTRVPSPTSAISRWGPMSERSTGRRSAMASSTAMGSPSHNEPDTNTSAASSSRYTPSRGMMPVKRMRFAMPRCFAHSRTWGRSGPSPTRVSVMASGSCAIRSMRKRWFFCSTKRPTFTSCNSADDLGAPGAGTWGRARSMASTRSRSTPLGTACTGMGLKRRTQFG